MSSGYNAVYRNDKDLYHIFGNNSGGDVSANTVNCNFLNSAFVNCDSIDRTTPGDLQINNDTLIVGDLSLNGNYDLSQSSGLLRLSNVTLSGSASGSSGQHLQIVVNGVNYKIRLENP